MAKLIHLPATAPQDDVLGAIDREGGIIVDAVLVTVGPIAC